MDKYTNLLDILKKGAGEGTRGGHVIGHTRAGNPIYDSSSHEGHANFKGQDHRDAMNQHHEIWSKTQEKIATVRQQNPNWNPPKEVHDFLKHHYTQMQMHQNQMSTKEDRAAKNKKVVGDAQSASAKPETPGKKFEPLKYGHMSKSEEIIPFFAAVIVVDSKKKNFLLGKRLDDGQWTAPAGGAVLGEFPKRTPIREVFEEAAIALDESQLQELPMGYAQGKPVHCYLAILTPEQMKCVSSDNDPDEEVQKWEWVPVTGKLPEPMDENRSATMLNAKMHLAGIMMKSYENLDAMEGMTSINTAEFKEENEESHPMKARIEELMKDYEAGDAPKRIPLDGEHILHLVKVDEGIFSGFVKRTNDEGLEETAVSLDKMPLPSIIQYLKAKEVLKDEKPHVEVEKEDSNLRQVIEQLAGMTVYGDVNITIKKAKALPVGTVRQWGVYKYVKHADGWVVIGGEHHGKLMGNFKSEPSHADFARHHENSSPKSEDTKGEDAPKKVDAGSTPKEEPKTEAKPEEEAPEEAPKKSREEEAKAGLELGKKAYHEGKKPIPAQDSALMKLLSERDRTTTSIHILEAWNKGWHSENINANPIEEPKKAEPKKKEEAKPKEKTADEKIAENNKRIEELTQKLKDIEEASKKAAEEKKKAEEASKKKEEEPKSEESELTPEQQKYREDNAVKVSRAEHFKAHTMSLKDYIAHGKKRQAEDMLASNARPGPSGEPVSDERKAEVKASIAAYMKRKDRTITKELKLQHKVYTEIAVNAGLPNVSEAALKEYPGLGGTDLPEGMDTELNKKTNLIKSVDLGTSSAKIKKQFTEHVNNCNKVVEAMGISFKTPLKFEAKGLSSLGKRVRGTYQNSSKTIVLKDMSAASKTLMHEIGHALDYAMQYMGSQGRHSEQMMKLRSLKEEERGELHKLYGELHEIVTQSDYYDKADSSFKRYLVTPTEVFARAFEVYSLQKAEELKLPQEFMDTFVPDIFKTKDAEVAKMREALDGLQKDLNKISDSGERDKKLEEYRTLRTEYSSKIEKTEGGWTTVSEDRQKEYKQKVSDIMSKILAKDEIRKAIQQMELADILRKSENFQKAQGLPVGSVRVWHGQKFIKQGDGHWVPMQNPQQGQSQPQPQAQPQAAAPQQEQPQAAQAPKVEEAPKEESKEEPKKEAGPLDHLKPQKGMGGHTELHSKDLDETLKNGKYSIISAGRNPANPEDRGMTDAQINERYKRLEQDLKDKGHKYTKVKGHYGGEEESFLVHHAEPKDMNELGKKYNQDSVIHSDKGENKLHFTTGDNADKHHKGKGFEEVPDAKDYYSVINTSDGQQKKFSLNLDFGKHHGADE